MIPFGALALAFCVAYLAGTGGALSSAAGPLASLALGFVGAVVIFTVLTRPGALARFGNAWAIMAALSGVIAALQALGRLPLWTVSQGELSRRMVSGHFYRGTGLKYDPNFEALVLVVGLIFARLYVKKLRTLTIAAIVIGIAATLSRMGILMVVGVLLLFPLLESRIGGLAGRVAVRRAFVGLVGIVVCAVLAAAVAPRTLSQFEEQRLHQIGSIYQMFNGDPIPQTGPNPSSAQERVMLAQAAIKIGRDHPLTGVGAFRTEEQIYDLTGDDKAAHNTYLESFAIGGLWGVLALLVYGWSAMQALRSARRPDEDPRDRAAAAGILAALALMCLTLTLDYNEILWLPLILLAAHERAPGQPRSGRGTAPAMSD